MGCIGSTRRAGLILGISLGLAGCTGVIGGSGPDGDDPANPNNPGGPGTPGTPGAGGGTGVGGGAPVDCSGTGTPSVGVSPLRRLTRSQYSHTVRDLLGMPGD